jgi:hypothetical protein
MPYCNNCDSFVSADYSRVFSSNPDGNVDVCPNCEDLVRADGKPRNARGPRRPTQNRGGAD